jgi:hypothetical protein
VMPLSLLRRRPKWNHPAVDTKDPRKIGAVLWVVHLG